MHNVYTVGQVNSYIKNMFTQDFVLNRLTVKGEVSNCKYHTSGHIYFTLKDESGTMACVMFAGQRKGLKFQLEEGQKVVAAGSVSVYERDGRYQLYAKEIILEGAGLLYQKFEQLKKELEEMGMFEAEYKQSIPKYSQRIGIVTAPTGAAIQDIRNIALRRNPYVQLILYPSLVQGDGAAETIVKGIQELDKQGLDVIIVGRGGGSMEDLWAFNEEAVARAVFQCMTPIISAVGHETDMTIIDFVADLRAPTPSAAAELAVFDIQLVEEQMIKYRNQFRNRMQDTLLLYRNQAEKYRMKLVYHSPEQQIREKRMYTAELTGKLQALMNNKLTERRHALQLYIEKWNGLSPLKKLNGGYSYVENKRGYAVCKLKDVDLQEEVMIHVSDGILYSTVEKKQQVRREK